MQTGHPILSVMSFFKIDVFDFYCCSWYNIVIETDLSLHEEPFYPAEV